MIHSLRTHPFRWATGAVAGLAVLAWLAFGYFGVHTLFIDDVVSEAAPVFDTPSVSAAAPAPESPSPSETPATSAPQAVTPEETLAPEATVETEAATEVAPVTTTTTPPVPEIVTEALGTFVSDAHPTSGRAVVLGNGTGQRFLRFEDFATDNGPDLNVYLVNSSTGDVSDFVDLGDLTGNIGDQNYEIPEGVDLAVYDTVYVWCVRFGVSFGNAPLAAV